MGLVIWIATFVKLLVDVFCYVDDTYSWELKQNLTYYPPYHKKIPTKQAHLLFLWDFLGIPHEKKQLHGSSLPIIGFEIDPNAMTATLPPQSKADLEKWVLEFINTPSRRRTLHEFQCLAGWINWSFNMYLLLRPTLSNIYDKMSGRSQSHASIYINTAIKSDLTWFLRKSGGPPADKIFFFKALCVVSALWWVCSDSRARAPSAQRLWVTIFTDNQNTVNIFDSLCATPNYNPLLRTAVDDLIEHNVDLRVLHVKGEKNYIADAISQQCFPTAIARAPRLIIQSFTPPQEPLGAAKL
ncbi:hypothetical protein FB451DRAFT_1499870 [Mycena latifolia]|nr:hypothetical protein FB451DRAFT_1499870 [Mycena latifolia]